MLEQGKHGSKIFWAPQVANSEWPDPKQIFPLLTVIKYLKEAVNWEKFEFLLQVSK